MATNEPYQAKQFKLSGLQGISDQTLEMHFKLYEGYVKETNRLSEKIWGAVKRRECRSGGDAGLFRAHSAPRF